MGTRTRSRRATRKDRDVAQQLVTVREAAQTLNRNAESVTKIFTDRRIEKHYANGSTYHFRVLWSDVERVYQETEAGSR
jgi:hypothetical protein